jgi:hypothetical protein
VPAIERELSVARAEPLLRELRRLAAEGRLFGYELLPEGSAVS